MNDPRPAPPGRAPAGAGRRTAWLLAAAGIGAGLAAGGQAPSGGDAWRLLLPAVVPLG